MGRRYLFPTDGSEPARTAEDRLLERVQPGDRVVVLHVVPDLPTYLIGDDYDPVQLEKQFLQASDHFVGETIERLEAAGVETQSIVEHGRPGQVILETAEKNDVDEIFMGRRGRGMASEFLLGSISHHVIHHAGCPVTVVPALTTKNKP